jgi:hypothetical protein
MADQHDVAELRIGLHKRRYAPEVARMVLRAAVTSVAAIGSAILDALHESRRRQAAREIARHRHLINSINSRSGRLPWENGNG